MKRRKDQTPPQPPAEFEYVKEYQDDMPQLLTIPGPGPAAHASVQFTSSTVDEVAALYVATIHNMYSDIKCGVYNDMSGMVVN